MLSTFAPLLAELGSIEKIAITVLSVAGGFLLGAIATHLLIAGTCRFVLKRKTPEATVRVVRIIGGVGAAIAVYFMLTGDGGFGLGGKGGSDSLNKNEGEHKEAATPKQLKVEPKKKEKIDTSSAEQINVSVLRSDSTDNRFYRFQNEAQPLTLDEVLARIDAKAKSSKKLVVLIQAADPQYPYQAATLLQRKLSDRGIPATLPQESLDAPKKN